MSELLPGLTLGDFLSCAVLAFVLGMLAAVVMLLFAPDDD